MSSFFTCVPSSCNIGWKSSSTLFQELGLLSNNSSLFISPKPKSFQVSASSSNAGMYIPLLFIHKFLL